MGFIIKPNTGGTTYPNISDVNDIVTINPIDQTNIQSDSINIIADTILQLYSNNNGAMNLLGFDSINFTDINLANILADNAFIVSEGGKLGFFSDTAQATQFAAIPDATALNYITTINNILSALRSYNLIHT